MGGGCAESSVDSTVVMHAIKGRLMDTEALEAALGLGLLVLTLAAIWSVSCSKVHRLGGKFLWAVVVLCVPVAGAVLWFFIGHETPTERDQRMDAT